MSAYAEINSIIDRAETAHEAADTSTRRTDISANAALAGLLVLAKQIDAISERVDALDPKAGADTIDIRAELSELCGQVKKLTKAIKKANK
jgi:hypothetical protein